MEIKVYKTQTCPKCRVLCTKLDQKGIKYEVCTDIELMQELGIFSVPILEVNGMRYEYSAAIKWVNEVEHEH